MYVSAKARYAISALVVLAQEQEEQKEAVTLKVLSRREDIPLSYLEQIFGKLRKAGLVTSMRGARGGYLLSKPCAEVRILDIIHAVDGPIHTTRCAFEGGKGCLPKGARCSTHHFWQGLGSAIQRYFASTTLLHITSKDSWGPPQALYVKDGA